MLAENLVRPVPEIDLNARAVDLDELGKKIPD
jgi:hypothetical protein